MTVDKYEVHELFGRALGYVKQGMQLLCSEDNQRLRKFACIEASVVSWQQRYCELQSENERLHRSLLAKDDCLQSIMQDISIMEELDDRLNCQEKVLGQLSEENQVLRQYIAELESSKTNQDALMEKIGLESASLQKSIAECQSDQKYSDLLVKATKDASTISGLESEVNQWRGIASNQLCSALNTNELQMISNKALQNLIWQLIGKEDAAGSNNNLAPLLTTVENVSEMSERIVQLCNDIDDLKKECESLQAQKSALQEECKFNAEKLSKLQSCVDRHDDGLCMPKMFQKLVDDLDSSNRLLQEAKLQHTALQSANVDLRSELEMQTYRNQALDELLAAKVQSGTVVDLHKFQQLEQEKNDLQTQLSDANSKRDLALQRLEESETRMQRLETKCQNLQESLDSDDQIRLKYRELFKELEESLSSNKRLRDANQEFEDRLKKLKAELDEVNAECENAKQELQDVVENYRLFKERADEDERERVYKFEALQEAFAKKSQLIEELQNQLDEQTTGLEQAKERNDCIEEELSSTKATLCNLKTEFDGIKSKYERLRIVNENLLSQVESAEVAKETALDIVSSTRSQLIETESRENALKDANQSLHATLAGLTEEIKAGAHERELLASELSSKSAQCINLEKELEENLDQIKTLRQQIESLKEKLNDANLRHVEDAERTETLQTENKQLKMRLDKLEDMNKMLRQDIPASQSDDSAIERERSKTKALSKQVTMLKSKFKDLEKDCQRWKALYEKEIVGKSLQ